MPKMSVVIPAAGESARFKREFKKHVESKLLVKLGGVSILERSLRAFMELPQVSEIVIATTPKLQTLFRKCLNLKRIPIRFVTGGKTRAESVLNGVKAVSKSSTHVMIHDGARPLIESLWVQKLINSLNGSDGAVLGRMAVPTVKKVSSGEIVETLNRAELFEAETPQFFKRDVLLKSYEILGKKAFQATDDSSIVELAGGIVKPVTHEGNNLKITTVSDLKLAEKMMSSFETRFGLGFDKHRLVKGRPFLLGGLRIPAPFGPLGHSDGDPLLHAVIDGMLGALGLGDIGDFFPDTSKKYKNISSIVMVKKAIELISKKNFQVFQIDSTIFLERPKLGPYKKKIQKKLSQIFKISESQISVKAKTAEGLGAEGKSAAVSAQALVVLKSKRDQ